MTALEARSTLYSPGAGVENFDLSLGRLCNEAAGGVSLPLAPKPVTLYCAGPGPSDSYFLPCFCPNVKAGEACFFESGTLVPSN